MEQALGIGVGWMEEDKKIEELIEEFEGGSAVAVLGRWRRSGGI